ncbi:ABC transporter substrate-binding protein [Rhodopila sp.]|jgi:4,5-dihydroxyphthalate decarboxylase|uniref:ABC transporter substrate-binding protein n=1 Tax=Rhodopila sp. TaxID=2480087 RepID=UPI002C80CCEE|nr:ABC transporter substrate-binding protein [Rhodopila sp.]HVZ07865.1 ABC transporter substrate-binding protein [Rhodopila sp.]
MADPVTLRSAFAPYPHVQAARTGRIASPRVILDIEDVPNITRAFRRMVRTLDFDLCEIALTTLAQAIAFGKPLTGLPVVVMRGFHHGALVCPLDSPISGPADLRGKRIGVRAFSQTTGVWLRGILLDEYGVDHRDITWVTEEDAHVTEYRDPPNVQRMGPGRSLPAMLLSGEIDAGIALAGLDASKVRPVIADPDKAAADWYRRTGVYPVNHVLCLRTDLVSEHPWLPEELLRLFVAARVAAAQPGAEARWAGIVGDPLPYGLGPNHAAIALCLRYAAEQGLVERVFTPEAVFGGQSAIA